MPNATQIVTFCSNIETNCTDRTLTNLNNYYYFTILTKQFRYKQKLTFTEQNYQNFDLADSKVSSAHPR